MPLRSLLVIAERSGEAQAALQRASVIARHAGASIELFTCDTEHAWALGEYERSAEARAVIDRCMAESMRYLEALRGSISAPDVRIDIHCACAPAMHEGIAARIASLLPQLVIKSLAGAGTPRAPLPLEMQIVQNCIAPLLLTHGTPWRPSPRIGVAAELAGPEPGADRAVAQFAAELAEHCAGSLQALPRGEEFAPSAGSPREALRAWVEEKRLDVLVLAAEPAAREERKVSLAEQLIGELPCDIITMPPKARPFPAKSVPVSTH